MTLVYTVAQQKGGAGKTMLAANLAAAFAAHQRVAVIDIDPQRSLTRWHQLRQAAHPAPPEITLATAAGWRLQGEIDRLRRDHAIVVIDSPPTVETDARVAIRAATLVLVPLQPSPPDLWAAEGTLKLAAAEKRPVRLVLNRAPATSRLRTQVEQACAAQGLQILAATLGNRAGYANAFAAGLGVMEQAPRSVAGREMLALVAAVQGAV